MSEETPLFKFKKKGTKKIGDFDVLDSSEWTLLIKPQIQDVTLFVHFRKLWNVEEQPEVLNADGEVEHQAVKQHPAYEFNTGFIKDDKFIVQKQKPVGEQTYHAIQKRYMMNLENLINEGYQKDWNNYNGDEPIVPHYYINERTSQEDLMMQQLAAQAKRQRPPMGSGNAVMPMQAAVTSVPQPSPKNKKFSLFKLKPQVVGKSTSEEVQSE